MRIVNWPHSRLNLKKLFKITHKLNISSIFSHSPLLPALHSCPNRPHRRLRLQLWAATVEDALAPSTAVQKLRRFNFFLHFIVAAQTTFKLLPSHPAPRPSSQNLCLNCPKIFTAQQSQDDFPSSKSGYSSNLGLMGCMELKTRQLQWKKWNLVLCMGVTEGGGGGFRLKLDWCFNGEWTDESLKDATCY